MAIRVNLNLGEEGEKAIKEHAEKSRRSVTAEIEYLLLEAMRLVRGETSEEK